MVGVTKMTKAAIKFTYGDYKNLPEAERERYELLEGELTMVPSPTPYHQDISRNLLRWLDEHVRNRKLGKVYAAPLDVVLSEYVVIQPDLLFISRERGGIIAGEAIRGAPDLAVEILSPATAERDRTYKKTLYARHGVKEYWLVDPDSQTIEVLTLGRRGYRQAGLYGQAEVLRASSLPGLEVPCAEVF